MTKPRQLRFIGDESELRFIVVNKVVDEAIKPLLVQHTVTTKEFKEGSKSKEGK